MPLNVAPNNIITELIKDNTNIDFIAGMIAILLKDKEWRTKEPYMVHCKACNATYDGAAQCCFDMDHENVEPSYSLTTTGVNSEPTNSEQSGDSDNTNDEVNSYTGTNNKRLRHKGGKKAKLTTNSKSKPKKIEDNSKKVVSKKVVSKPKPVKKK